MGRILRAEKIAPVARRLVPPDQEGCQHPQALGEEPQRYRLQVSLGVGGEPYPPFGTLLQENQGSGSQLEIRFRHRICPRRISVVSDPNKSVFAPYHLVWLIVGDSWARYILLTHQYFYIGVQKGLNKLLE